MADIEPDAAILLMLLDDEQAAQIVSELSPQEVEKLGKAMIGLSEVGAKEAESALARFVVTAQQESSLAVDGAERTRSVFAKALGDQQSSAVMGRLRPAAPRGQLTPLKWIADDDLVALVEEEHPQVGAVIIADADPDRAARIMLSLRPEMQEDIVRRLARMKPVDPIAVEELSRLIGERVARPAPAKTDRAVRITSTAAILSRMPKPADQALLRAVGKRDKILMQDLSDEMFVFTDVLKLSAKALSQVVRAVEADVLALAMRPLNAAARESLLAGLSARAADTIRDELAEGSPVAMSAVELAQKTIVASVRRMEADGTLTLGQEANYV